VTSSIVFAWDLKEYDVSLMIGRTSNAQGKQIIARQPDKAMLAVYDKGESSVKKQGVDSHTVAVIYIYSRAVGALTHDDQVIFNGKTYTVTEVKNRDQHSFYKAVAYV